MTRLEVGHIARAHGLRGEVIVALTTNRHERVAPGSELEAGDRRLRVLTSTPHLGRWIVAFAGVEDRAGADSLRGLVLHAAAIEDTEALWVHELIGCRLVDQDGRDRGEIVEVQANPASDLLVLQGGGLVPLRFVTDRRHGMVVTELPEGLLE